MIAAHPMLGPVLALITWTMAVLAWMTLARSRAFRRAQLPISKLPPGTHGHDLDQLLDPHAQWKAHNYNHLLEQPTVFYPLCLALVAAGAETIVPSTLAWSYVVLRVCHSLVQSSINIVLYRAIFFALSSACLLALTLFAVWTAL